MYQDIRQQIQAISIPVSSTIREVMQAIDRGALGLALLVDADNGAFVGLATDGDIRRALLAGMGLESPVSDVQRPDPQTARADATSDSLAAMFNGPVRIIPLLDEHARVVDLAMLDRRMRLPVAEPSLGEKELQYTAECVLTGWVSSAGPFVTRFEEMFAQFCGTRYAITASNGTTALHLALLALGIGLGDEVIVPTLTFIATANAVTYTGARPVFVDSESETWNIDPLQIEEAITPRTRAIIPVHLYGHPANMAAILDIARKHNLYVIEDAAEAHGARYQDRVVGGIGDIGVFSFYGNKIITTGEGGMLVTNRDDLAARIRILRDHGMSSERRYWHPVLGYNYRMTNIQAALGVAQMERIDNILAAKRQLAETYNVGLAGVPGITLPPAVSWARSVFWLYSIIIDPDRLGMSRDVVMAKLQLQQIETRPLFPPVHTQPIYATEQDLPIAQSLSQNGLSLPSSIGLTARDVARIVSTITELAASATA